MPNQYLNFSHDDEADGAALIIEVPRYYAGAPALAASFAKGVIAAWRLDYWRKVDPDDDLPDITEIVEHPPNWRVFWAGVNAHRLEGYPSPHYEGFAQEDTTPSEETA